MVHTLSPGVRQSWYDLIILLVSLIIILSLTPPELLYPAPPDIHLYLQVSFIINSTLKYSSATISSSKTSSPFSLIEKHLQPLADPGAEWLPILPAPGGLQHQGDGVQEGELQ